MAELTAEISAHIAAWLWIAFVIYLLVLGIERLQGWRRR
jgi:hypothetical protein